MKILLLPLFRAKMWVKGPHIVQKSQNDLFFLMKILLLSLFRTKVWVKRSNIVQKSKPFPSYGSFMSHERLLAAVYLSFCSRRANEVFGP